MEAVSGTLSWRNKKEECLSSYGSTGQVVVEDLKGVEITEHNL